MKIERIGDECLYSIIILETMERLVPPPQLCKNKKYSTIAYNAMRKFKKKRDNNNGYNKKEHIFCV
jgi:hypothetical protein